MKLLILTQWYPPEPVILLEELAQTLQDLGHTVNVLTGFPNYPSGEIYPGYRLSLCHKENRAEVPVTRVPLYPNHGRSGIKRVLNYLSFALSSSILGILVTPKPDVIFVYHPPLTIGLPAFWLSRLWHVPFVYQIQDLWPETLRATGMLTNKRVLNWVGKFAQWIYSKADAICVISPGFRQNLITKSVPIEKLHVISNWIDTKLNQPAPYNNVVAKDLGLADKFNIMFAGNIGEAQALETILQAAAVLLHDLPEVQFVLVGDGIALPRLRSMAQERNLINVRFLGRHPQSEMPTLYALADVLLVHLRDDPLFSITIPHKVFSYMASRKPILAAVAGDSAEIIGNAQAGLACPPENPEVLAFTVRRLFHMSPAERDNMAQNGWRVAQEQYSRENQVRQIEAVLTSVVQQRRPIR
jgi:glycosyltransferase involved in cell wall biosynthesis